MSVWPILTLPASAGLLGLAAWFTMSVDTSLPDVRPPGLAVNERIASVRLELPPIQRFEHYYGNRAANWRNLNPFVPYLQREREQARLENPDPPEVISVLPDPPPSRPEVAPQPPPQLELPTARFDAPIAPVVRGALVMDGIEILIVSLPNGADRRLRIGDEIDGWQLLGREGLLAVFTDPDGVRQLIPIGVADNRSTAGAAGAGGRAGSGGPSGVVAGGPSSVQPEAPLPPVSGNADVDELMRQISEDPLGRRWLANNPTLGEQLRNDPAQARELLKRLEQYRRATER